MDFEKLIERVVGELEGALGEKGSVGADGGWYMDPYIDRVKASAALCAAFAEVRRDAIEDAICDAEAGVANLLERLRDLLPPAAEGVDRG